MVEKKEDESILEMIGGIVGFFVGLLGFFFLYASSGALYKKYPNPIPTVAFLVVLVYSIIQNIVYVMTDRKKFSRTLYFWLSFIPLVSFFIELGVLAFSK